MKKENEKGMDVERHCLVRREGKKKIEKRKKEERKEMKEKEKEN